jgi:AbrB family looped-hinge helix DNA binding protein
MSIYKVHQNDLIKSRVDGKGRVTIPKEEREKWQIESGEQVEFAVIETEGSGYVCDGCDGRFNLEEVFVNRTTGSVKCPDCMTPEERIID